jgi:hypothetical protein
VRREREREKEREKKKKKKEIRPDLRKDQSGVPKVGSNQRATRG